MVLEETLLCTKLLPSSTMMCADAYWRPGLPSGQTSWWEFDFLWPAVFGNHLDLTYLTWTAILHSREKRLRITPWMLGTWSWHLFWRARRRISPWHMKILRRLYEWVLLHPVLYLYPQTGLPALLRALESTLLLAERERESVKEKDRWKQERLWRRLGSLLWMKKV